MPSEQAPDHLFQLTKEQTKALNDETAYLAAAMTNLTSAFGNQKIKTRHSTKGWESLTFSALSKKVQNLAEKSSLVLEF